MAGEIQEHSMEHVWSSQEKGLGHDCDSVSGVRNPGALFPSWPSMCSFFSQGYAFQTSINIGFQPPRLVFVARAMDKTARFFLAFFSKGGLRINLIHPPSVVQDTIGHALMDAFPDLIAYDEDIDHIRSIELKREATRKTRRLNFEPTQSSASTVDASYFLLRVLRALSDVGFNLETTIPLGSNSNWSLRSSTDIGTHRELYVFKGVPSHRVG